MNTSELHLDRNENLYGPSPQCLEVLRRIGVDDLSMYSRDFVRGVKSSLSERVGRDLGIPEQQILLSDGSEDMLRQAVHCYVRPGEKVLCSAQSWWYYRSMASEVGGETITYELKRQGSAYIYDVDEVNSRFRRLTPRLIVIGSPNNPTGNSFPLEALGPLTEAFSDSTIVLDEAYHGFAGPGREHIAALVAQYPMILVVRSFSKYYALAGARVGYAAAGTGLNRLTTYASRYLGHNRISEVLALAALDSPEYYTWITRQLCEDRERYQAFFDQCDGFTCYRSDGNFVLVRVPRESVDPLRRFLHERKILIKFFAEPEFADCVRITIGTREQNDRLLSALREFLSTARLPHPPA